MRKKDIFFTVEKIASGRKAALGWVEESYNPDFYFNQKRQDFLSLSLSGKRLAGIFLVLAAGLLALWFRSFYLQVWRGEYYFSLAENNRLKIEYVKAQRGIIYDRNSQVLVNNVFGFSLLVTASALPQDNQAKEKELAELAAMTGLAIEKIKEILADNRDYYWQPVVIATGLDYDRAMAIQIKASDLPGVSLETDFWRRYPSGESLSHVLGYVGKINPEEYEANKEGYLLSDNIGKIGLEKYYEDYLRGVHGQKNIEVDSWGREKKIVAQTAAVPGSNLILSLDLGLQNKVYEVMKEKLGDQKAGAVIVSNPQTGEILSLVDYPSYDNNLFSLGIGVEDYNKLLNDPRKPFIVRSVSGEYPSGSTIKPVMASAALQEGVIDSRTSFNSVGGIYVGQWFFPDWRAGGHGVTNVTKAIAQSVNTFFYYVGGGYGEFQGLGLERMVKYFRLFGLGQTSGIDLPGEKTGFVPTREWKETVKDEPWYIGDTYHLSIGQGDLLVTPLQVNNYINAVANGGTLYRPYLVQKVIHPDGRIEEIKPQISNQNLISPANLEIVRQGMRETVASGSARSLSSLPVEAAGKTGTAQWNSNKDNHAWFTAFAPYNQPNFCITVLVEEGGEGSSISVPIALEIMRYWFGERQS